ncbi:MAG: hypothetical protein QM731_14895 [Chitinophagaceae bacterium]
MNTKLLLPNRFKTIGLFLLVPMVALAIAGQFYQFSFSFLNTASHPNDSGALDINENLTDEVFLTGIILGLLFIGFAREKHEDEFINKLRLESLQWAVLVNYILLIIATWVIYGFNYFDVMLYNMLTVLVIFVIRFHVVLYRSKPVTD